MIASTNNGLLFCLMNNVWVAGTIFFFFLLKYIFVKYVLHVMVFHGFCSRKFKVQYKVADGNSYQNGLYHCMYVNFNSPEWIIYTGIQIYFLFPSGCVVVYKSRGFSSLQLCMVKRVISVNLTKPMQWQKTIKTDVPQVY